MLKCLTLKENVWFSKLRNVFEIKDCFLHFKIVYSMYGELPDYVIEHD